MKKSIVLVLLLVLLLTGCASQKDFNEISKGYIDSEEHFEQDGFQDYADYAKYIYSSIEIIENDREYEKVGIDDISSIKLYFENFRDRMEMSDRLDEYDFDERIINEGDYIRIKTKEGEKIGNSKYQKYDNYTVYYFDIETLTLYYIHSNI